MIFRLIWTFQIFLIHQNSKRLVWTDSAWFDFAFLQKSSVSSFARFIEFSNFGYSSKFHSNRLIFRFTTLNLKCLDHFNQLWSNWQDYKMLHFWSQLFCKIHGNIQIFDIRWSFSRIDWFSSYNTKFEVSGPFLPIFDPFGRIWNILHFCRQLFCRIYRNFKHMLFVEILVESIDFRFTTLILKCLDNLHHILIHLAGFENFAFLQKS